MAKTNTVHVMKKEIEILQQQMKILTRDVVDLKLKVSPDSAVASEVHVGAETDSSESAETLLKTEQEFFETRLKTLEERLEALQNSLAERNQRLQPDKLIDVKDANGKTALFRAVQNHDITKITFLLKKGADEHLFFNGFIPLHRAAHDGHADTCALLLLMGKSNVNAQSENSKSSALHLAAEKGHIKTMEVLLECGADMNLKNAAGITAYDVAVKNKITSSVNFFDSRF
ncbi:hypothetical protein C0J52_27846 [Blattella germanica]|nr:hypothetical protein C0J52_27846 [Blattella germanica]